VGRVLRRRRSHDRRGHERTSRDGDVPPDLAVARAALAADLDVSLAYCLLARDDDGIALSTRLERAPSAKELGRLRKFVGAATDDESHSEARLEALGEEDPVPTVHVGWDWEHATFLMSGLYSHTGYYGNEASEATYYVAAVLDIAAARRGESTKRAVSHPRFGRGVVVASSGEAAERRLRIRFDDGEERVLLERFVSFVSFGK
jgi:hypothetical protein